MIDKIDNVDHLKTLGKNTMSLVKLDNSIHSSKAPITQVQTEYIVITGEVIYEALLDTCWDEPYSEPNISELMCSAVLLKLELYLNKLGLGKTKWAAVQIALTAYLKNKNLSITVPMRSRLYKILDHFSKDCN